jgi:hypothetical protein
MGLSMPALSKYQSICAKDLCKKILWAAMWIKRRTNANTKAVLNKKRQNEVQDHAK